MLLPGQELAHKWVEWRSTVSITVCAYGCVETGKSDAKKIRHERISYATISSPMGVIILRQNHQRKCRSPYNMGARKLLLSSEGEVQMHPKNTFFYTSVIQDCILYSSLNDFNVPKANFGSNRVHFTPCIFVAYTN